MVQESPAVSIPYLVNRYSDKQDYRKALTEQSLFTTMYYLQAKGNTTHSPGKFIIRITMTFDNGTNWKLLKVDKRILFMTVYWIILNLMFLSVPSCLM